MAQAMRQITMGQIRKANASQIQDWVPFSLISDGKVVAIVGSATSGVVPRQAVPQANSNTLASYPGNASGRVARRYQIMVKGNRVTVTEGQAYSCYGVQGIAPWLDQDGQPIPE